MGQSQTPLKKFVRVTGVRSGRYVEFEFSVNDADLTVELILPFAAFEEFCTLQEAVRLPPEGEVAPANSKSSPGAPASRGCCAASRRVPKTNRSARRAPNANIIQGREIVTVQIKTIDLEPKRQTFGHIARRLGGDKPASRYQEATLDVQATDNFHYKPLWEPEFWHYDTGKTAVVMEDWYKPLDPRQYYYAAYNIARANMNQAVERNFAFIEERGLIQKLSPEAKAAIERGLLPAAPSALGLEHEHVRDLPARLRHGRHGALHLLGRRSSRHGSDRFANRARTRRADRREPRKGQGDLALRRRLAGRAPADRGHLRRARLLPALRRPDARRERRAVRHALQACRRGVARRLAPDRDADRVHVATGAPRKAAGATTWSRPSPPRAKPTRPSFRNGRSHWIDRAAEAAKPLSVALLNDDGRAAHAAREAAIKRARSLGLNI